MKRLQKNDGVVRPRQLASRAKTRWNMAHRQVLLTPKAPIALPIPAHLATPPPTAPNENRWAPVDAQVSVKKIIFVCYPFLTRVSEFVSARF